MGIYKPGGLVFTEQQTSNAVLTVHRLVPISWEELPPIFASPFDSWKLCASQALQTFERHGVVPMVFLVPARPNPRKQLTISELLSFD